MVYIVGVGPGKEEYLTVKAKKIIEESECIATTSRLENSLKPLNDNILSLSLSEIENFVRENIEKNPVILVSGDTGFFSLSETLRKSLTNIHIENINGISSMQYFFGKIGKKYNGVLLDSVHGRKSKAVSKVSYNEKVFFLTGGDIKAHTVIRELIDTGLKNVKIWVGENLGLEKERILYGTAIELENEEFDNLSVIYIENENYGKKQYIIDDSQFIRGKVPMTKMEVRCLATSLLNIQPDDTVYDIGAGTGSCSIEMAMKAYDGKIYAIERKEEGIELIKQNKEKFGTYNIEIIKSYAPEGLSDLPAPDKVFIGGSGRELDSIIKVICEKNNTAKIIITAITLETLEESRKVLKKYGYNISVTSVSVSRSESLGSYTMMKPENTVYIIKGDAADEQ